MGPAFLGLFGYSMGWAGRCSASSILARAASWRKTMPPREA